MARVIVPQNPRVYNPNARGAVTTLVHMKANNPFENGRAIVTKPALMRRGALAGLGEGEAAPAPAATGSGIDWGSLAEKAASIGTGVITALNPPPVAAAPKIIVNAPAGMSTTTKVLIAGGVAAVGILALVLVMKKS